MMYLFLWRDLDVSRDPDTFAMTVVNMGDRPSATIAQVALKKSADEKKSIYPESADIIQRYAYMDDIIGGGDSEEESCLRRA